MEASCRNCKHTNKNSDEEPCCNCYGDYSKFEAGDSALLAALKLIRDECNKHEYCNECPLRLCENSCYLLREREKSVRPGKWKFDGEEKDEPKRLFL